METTTDVINEILREAFQQIKKLGCSYNTIENRSFLGDVIQEVARKNYEQTGVDNPFMSGVVVEYDPECPFRVFIVPSIKEMIVEIGNCTNA